VGPRAGLDAVVKRKIPSPCRDSNPRSSSPQSSAIPLCYPGSFKYYDVFVIQSHAVLIPITNVTSQRQKSVFKGWFWGFNGNILKGTEKEHEKWTNIFVSSLFDYESISHDLVFTTRGSFLGDKAAGA
jgi:hypothetical protein